VLDVPAFSKYVPAHLATTVFATFQALGQEFNKYVDPGEAFTLAAAVTLNVPSMSNDKSALDALHHNGLQLPSSVLRAFDLLCFAYQIGALEDSNCDKVRKELLQQREHVPAAFRNACFQDGLKRFTPRIVDRDAIRIGAIHSGSTGYDAQLIIVRK